MSQIIQLEIDECVYWILHTIVSSESLKYNHIILRGQSLEFIVVEAKDYFLDVRGLMKIEKITGMSLVQIRSKEGISSLWFGRQICVTPRHLM